jgi:radical SAM protein with 4Fe4S-binding SPASM domain
MWVRLVEELADLGCCSIGLTGGEVTLHPEWLRIAAAVRRRNVMLHILTNGTRLSADDLDEIASLHPVRVAISLYSIEPEWHDRVTGAAGSFYRSVEAIKGLVERGIACRVNTVLLRGRAGEAVRLRDFAEAMGCAFACNPVLYPSLDGSRPLADLQASRDDLMEFYSQMLPFLPRELGAVESNGASRRVMKNCGAGITSAYIDCSGEVYACPGFGESFGNAAALGFGGAWQSASAEEHRAVMREPLRACGDCAISSYCTMRCPKLALSESGSLLGTNQMACEIAGVFKDIGKRYRYHDRKARLGEDSDGERGLREARNHERTRV